MPGIVFLWGKVISEVFDARVEAHLIEPTLVMDMPRDISPLAKNTPQSNPRLVEHFDAYIAGMEMGCAYSELSNPLEQRARFDAQSADREAGDDEAQMLDEDFVTALENGFRRQEVWVWVSTVWRFFQPALLLSVMLSLSDPA